MRKILLALAVLISIQLQAQDTVKADARLTTATVYYGYGAELTHETKVNVRSNVRQILISQLSTEIDENSVQISVPDNVALLSHKYSVFYPSTEKITNPVIKLMQDTI
ncbi:MAG: DUF4140 domain-containing protein, partial [Sphingobacteriales bacterium]